MSLSVGPINNQIKQPSFGYQQQPQQQYVYKRPSKGEYIAKSAASGFVIGAFMDGVIQLCYNPLIHGTKPQFSARRLAGWGAMFALIHAGISAMNTRN